MKCLDRHTPLALLVLLFAVSPLRAGEDWTKLLNGKDFAGWETYLHKPLGQTEPIGVNKDPNQVFTMLPDGVLRISGETFGVLSTLQDYENYHLRLEFKWGEKRWPPRHDKKRDSGILYHAHGGLGSHGPWSKSLECQIQEGDCGDFYTLQTTATFTVKTDDKSWKTFDPSGSLHDHANGPVTKSANHEKPNGEWNLIEVICQGDSATHIVNGQIVNRLTNARMREGDSGAPLTRGRIQLQSEGAEVFYRNVEIRSLRPEEAQVASTPTTQRALRPSAPPAANGMAKIFNGTDLTGWDGDKRLWRVEDGMIVGQTTLDTVAKTNTFLIYRGGGGGQGGAQAGEVKDFELRLSYRIHGGNSGVQYRSAIVDDPSNPSNTWRVSGYQAEIANLAGKDGFLYHEGRLENRGYPEKKRYLCYVGDKVTIGADGKSVSVGSLADNAALAATYRKGEWNDYVIIARGNVIKHFLNGYQTVEATDNDPANSRAAGIVALQLHAGPPMHVEFRDVRLKHFDGAASKP